MSFGAESLLMELGDAALPEAIQDPLEPIILSIRAGDREAFESLMVLTERRVLGLAWRLLRNREQALDASQEVFLRIYRSLDGFRLGENFMAWAARITVNVCADLAKRRGPTSSLDEGLDSLPHPDSANQEQSVLRGQQQALLRQALAVLSPGERNALVLRDLEGLSTGEAAAALGVQSVTVRSQVSSARAKLRKHLAPHLRRWKGGPP